MGHFKSNRDFSQKLHYITEAQCEKVQKNQAAGYICPGYICLTVFEHHVSELLKYNIQSYFSVRFYTYQQMLLINIYISRKYKAYTYQKLKKKQRREQRTKPRPKPEPV